MATRLGTGKIAKHVELRFSYVQNFVQMGLLTMAEVDGTRNSAADLMTQYVATDVLQRFKTHLGLFSNLLKNNAATHAHDPDDHVAATTPTTTLLGMTACAPSPFPSSCAPCPGLHALRVLHF